MGFASKTEIALAQIKPEYIQSNVWCRVTKMRRRIERDDRKLKQAFGLGQYESRNWRGLDHLATLCITAYGFLLGKRLRHRDKKLRSTTSVFLTRNQLAT